MGEGEGDAGDAEGAGAVGGAAGELKAGLAAGFADDFDIHLDHAPKEGATLDLDTIVLVARSISGGRVNIIGLRLPEDPEELPPTMRSLDVLKQKLASFWSSVAGI